MLLHSLVQHADSREDAVPDYYQRRAVMWRIDLSSTGNAEPLITDLRPAKVKEPRTVTAPYTGRSGKNPPPFLLADSALYVLAHPGLVKQPDGKKVPSTSAKDITKANERHAAYRAMVTSWCNEHPGLPQAHTLTQWLKTPAPDSWPEGMEQGHLVAISVDGEWIHDLPQAQRWWAEKVRSAKSGKPGTSQEGICLVCGQQGSLLSTLPVPIKGLPGSGMNTQLICLNQPAHYRAGLKQLGATPICVECGTKATTALNTLLADPDHHTGVGDSALVWWTRDATTEIDMWTLDNPEPTEVAQLIDGRNHPRQGRDALAAVDEDAFHAVTLRVNTNRVIVADWITIPVPELKQRLGTWFADQQTWDGWNNTYLYWSVWRLALAAARWDKRKNKYIDTTTPKHLQADLAKAALHGTPPPAHVLPILMQRIRADHHIDWPRIALLRLTLTRTTTRHKELCVPQLNPASTEPGYVCGRIMAMLEAIQRKAMPKVNTTITDKYLTTAVVSPRAPLTRLRIGARPHLRTIARTSEPAAKAMENRMREAFDLLDSLPAHLNAEQQALFILGYEHQRAHSARAAAQAIKAREAGKELSADQAADALPEAADDAKTSDSTLW
ncbi:type I-C CRISPR-associated protein Cas8c/Csd1 [Streptomyces sp. NPDC007205]|uniref:type I-C CRISPR-associated protein Cas8c/Csd1 n=1 Tax=Streptomyces sp. NPDC007205 TaxID=3154316 RepID=UPI0033CB3ECC